MKYLLADPTLVVLPSSKATVQQKHQFLESSISFLPEVQARGGWLSSEVMLAANQSGTLPTYSNLVSFLSAGAGYDVSPGDLARVFDTLFRQGRYIEDEMGILETACDDFSVEPGAPYTLFHDTVVSALARGLCALGAVREENLTEIVLAARETGTQLRCQVRGLLVSTKDGNLLQQPQAEFTFQVFCTREALISGSTLTSAWPNPVQALLQTLVGLGHTAESANEVMSHVKFSDTFGQSIETFGFNLDNALLTRLMTVIAHIVTGIADSMKGIEPRELRVSAGGGSSPLRDGSRRAMRADVSHGWKKLRLHYWKDGADFYFSGLVQDNDDSICNWGE